MLRLVHRIDEAVVLKALVVQQTRNDFHILFSHQLIGHQNAADAMCMRHPRLVRGRQRDAPGPSLQLALEELGRHGGFSVRSQLHPIGLDELLHPGKVMRQLVFI